ncbi:MAG: MetQ/NlpA family ABC transporter substrate-binding protein [Clostridia bacterium]|nr:MetQ/NlpA family ABC transporter substrate-binding protein [Clostridia bacterium]
MKKVLSLIIASAFVLCALFAFASCGNKTDDKTITVAATATPHAEILEQCKAALEAKGYKLVIKVVDDYVTPNTATEDGEVDANYFQHIPYLSSFNDEYKTHLVQVAQVHYEPFGIYAGTCKSLADLKDGDKIAVPNDTTNEARALLLLADNGLITLKEGAGLTATKNDITSNPHNFEIMEIEAALVPTVLDDVAIGVINGNYALAAGLKVSNALAAEKSTSTAAQTYANILVVKDGNQNLEKIKALVEVLTSDAIATYITNTYDGAVVSMR